MFCHEGEGKNSVPYSKQYEFYNHPHAFRRKTVEFFQQS